MYMIELSRWNITEGFPNKSYTDTHYYSIRLHPRATIITTSKGIVLYLIMLQMHT
jgi:hypothetical protein